MKKIIVFFSMVLLIVSIFFIYSGQKEYEKITLKIKGVSFYTDIADNDIKRIRGLSHRYSLADNSAMLFVFDEPAIRKFWMKDMFFPIDIIWLNENKEIIHIEKNISPSTYPKSFGPDLKSLYVIEVSSGTSEKLSLSIGEKIEF